MGFEGTAVGHVPEFGLEIVGSILTLPDIVHDGEGLLLTSHREEFVLGAVDEEHRLGTGDTGDVRIVEPTAQTRQTVGKAAVLRSAVM